LLSGVWAVASTRLGVGSGLRDEVADRGRIGDVAIVAEVRPVDATHEGGAPRLVASEQRDASRKQGVAGEA